MGALWPDIQRPGTCKVDHAGLNLQLTVSNLQFFSWTYKFQHL